MDDKIRALVHAHRAIAQAKAERLRLINELRADGATWRTIADALNMTVEGATKIAYRAAKKEKGEGR